MALPYEQLINQLAMQSGLDPALIHGVVRAESGYNPSAVSPVGAQGLMQLMPGTAKQYGATDPFNPEQNLGAGVRYLKYLMEKFKDPELALAAYNAGPGNVMKYGGIPPFKETQNYVAKILGGMPKKVEFPEWVMPEPEVMSEVVPDTQTSLLATALKDIPSYFEEAPVPMPQQQAPQTRAPFINQFLSKLASQPAYSKRQRRR